MKTTINNPHTEALGRVRSASFLPAALLGLFLLGPALPAWASGAGSAGTPPNGSSGGTGPNNGSGNGTTFNSGGGDDETVGTLPSAFGGSGLVLHRNVTITRPALFAEGNLYQILGSVLNVRGHGDVVVQSLNPVTGWTRIVFLDDAQITFDREMLALAPVRFGFEIPRQPISGQTIEGLQSGRRTSTSNAIGLVGLPIVSLLSSGALEQAPFQAFAGVGRNGTHVWAQATHDVMVLGQSH